MRTQSEKLRKKPLKPDHPMILNSNNDELRIYTNPDHAMIRSNNNNISTPKRTPEDRAKSQNYYKNGNQSCKD